MGRGRHGETTMITAEQINNHYRTICIPTTRNGVPTYCLAPRRLDVTVEDDGRVMLNDYGTGESSPIDEALLHFASEGGTVDDAEDALLQAWKNAVGDPELP